MIRNKVFKFKYFEASNTDEWKRKKEECSLEIWKKERESSRFSTYLFTVTDVVTYFIIHNCHFIISSVQWRYCSELFRLFWQALHRTLQLMTLLPVGWCFGALQLRFGLSVILSSWLESNEFYRTGDSNLKLFRIFLPRFCPKSFRFSLRIL